METVIDSFERCDINYDNFDGGDLRGLPRPLHFVASFESNKPIGLTLSEASNENDSNMSEADWSKWKAATENSFPGEVFVKGFSKGGQADCMGIFEIGDRLRGVGELPFVGEGGFDGAVKLVRLLMHELRFMFHYFAHLYYSRIRLKSNQRLQDQFDFILIDNVQIHNRNQQTRRVEIIQHAPKLLTKEYGRVRVDEAVKKTTSVRSQCSN